MIKLITKWTERKRIAQERLKVCETCDQIELDTYRCKKCGCFMKFKTEIPFSDCPLGKWNSYEEKKNG